MATKRVKIHSLRDGTSLKRNDDLCKLICDIGISFSKCLPSSNEHFILVCQDEKDVDLLISEQTIRKLKSNDYEVIIPPQLRCKKTVVLKGLDKRINKMDESDILTEIETKNPWATVEEVIKFKNIPYMLKIRFRDIQMAKKAIDSGLKISWFKIPNHQIEEEEFVPITPCWICYKYTHTVRNCPEKDNNVKYCSECAQNTHTYKECMNRQTPKCLNCEGPHRTLAATCPVRKELIKEAKKSKQDRQKQFETENKTYCAVAKLKTEIPKALNKPPEQTILNLNSDISIKILTIIITAHLENLAKPGSFGAAAKTLLRMNNLPDINLPDDAPSAAIFGAMKTSETSTEQSETARPQEGAVALPTEEQDTTTDEGSIEIGSEQQEMETDSQTQETPYTPVKSKVKQFEKAPPAPPPSPIKQKQQQKQKQTQVTKDTIELKFYASEGSKIPTFLPTNQLIQCYQTNRIKFTFNGDIIDEDDIVKFIKQGRLTTKDFPIQTVDVQTFRKLRTGPVQSHGNGTRPKTKK